MVKGMDAPEIATAPTTHVSTTSTAALVNRMVTAAEGFLATLRAPEADAVNGELDGRESELDAARALIAANAASDDS